METSPNRSALIHGSTLVLGAGLALGLSLSARSATGLVAGCFAGFGVLVVLLSWVQGWLRAAEAREQREIEDLKRAQPGSALFAAGAESLRARRSREFFEKWMVPLISLVLALAQGGVAWGLWRHLATSQPLQVGQATLLMALFALLALSYFLLGKYAAGLARLPAHRLVRPAAGQLLFAALLSCLVVAASLIGWLGHPQVDRWLARALVIVLGTVALETGVALLLELYRPRTRDREAHPVYESRLVSLLSQPGGLLSTAAGTLDYQFGFKVSETWFYRWLERSFAWLLLLQAGLLWLTSTVVVVAPHEQATLERFGRLLETRGVLGPGLHFKLPWPAEQARVFSVGEVRGFNVGFVPDPQLEAERTLLWTRPHYREEINLLVASREQGDDAGNPDAAVPVNLLTASIPVQFIVTNVLDWAYRHAEPALLLERLATREVAHYLVSVDMLEIMATGRREAADELRERIQERANREQLGVAILLVGLQDIHPPMQVAEAYEAVIGATQERERRILEARAYAAERVPLAGAESVRLVSEAQAARYAKVSLAAGQAGQFTNQLAAFLSSPAVYQRRAYLDAIVAGTRGARKYLLTSTNLQQDYWLNLEDKLRPDLLDVNVPAAPSRISNP